MNKFRTLILCLTLVLTSSQAMAIRGVTASGDDVTRLKNDIKKGMLQTGQTRLNWIRDNYGEAPNIVDSQSRIVYDYGDLRLEFDKKRIWKYWEYDTFKDAVYTDDIDDLRFDLESDEIAGKNITYTKIRKDYDEPTESFQTEEDGGLSVYYYGDIKIVFENMFTMKTFRASNLTEADPSEGILGTK